MFLSAASWFINNVILSEIGDYFDLALGVFGGAILGLLVFKLLIRIYAKSL